MQKSKSSFPPQSFEEWKVRAEKELSGPVFRSWEGAELSLFYTPDHQQHGITAFDNNVAPSGHREGMARSWGNIAIVDDQQEKKANGHALNALMSGADGILFRNSGEFEAGMLLADILPDYASLLFTGTDMEFATSYRKWLDHQDSDHNAVKGYLQFNSVEIPPELFRLFDDYHGIRFLHFHLEEENHAMTAQLAGFLEVLTKSIDTHSEKKISLQDIWDRLSVSVSGGPLFFEEIARLRAIRLLIYKIFRAYGLSGISPEEILIHGISAVWEKEDFQPHANMLKGCTTGLAQVLGGSTMISILPEDPSSELQQRVARNVSLILKEECFMDKVNDPAAGSWYIEALTTTLARNAWKLFTKSADNP